MRPSEQIRYLILAAQREGNRLLAQHLQPLGLTPAQAETLRVLGERQPMTLTDVGGMLVCDSGSNPSRLVDRLVAAGLVRKAPDPADKRAILLSLTPTGQALVASVTAVEAAMYDVIDDALVGHDVDRLLVALRALVGDLPSGQALERRMSAPRPVAANAGGAGFEQRPA